MKGMCQQKGFFLISIMGPKGDGARLLDFINIDPVPVENVFNLLPTNVSEIDLKK
jgi:hypothetical protein